MKLYRIIIAILFAFSLIAIYISSVWEINIFGLIGALSLYLALAIISILIIKTQNRVLIYVIAVIALNIPLSYLTIKEILYWEDLDNAIMITSYVLLLYTILFFGYRKYKNIIYTISLILSFTLYSLTGFLYYSSLHGGFRLSSGNAYKIILINILIGITSAGLLLLLSKIKNKYISKYSQIVLQFITVTIMLYILYWLFTPMYV